MTAVEMISPNTGTQSPVFGVTIKLNNLLAGDTNG